ncbi:MAG: to ribosomal protein [Planctomycetota bacterium]
MATSTANKYTWGTGRRKTATARVRVRPGTGTFLINGREIDAYFPDVEMRNAALNPLRAIEGASKYDVLVTTIGGGLNGQAAAITMGLARALMGLDATLEAAMREHGFLTRDSRMKERKKYGRAGARRSFQFSKR